MAQKAKSPRHRMGKKHRSAETRPRKGRNPKSASDAAKAGKKANARKAAEKAAANPGSRPSSKAGARKSPARAALTPAADESDWQIIDPIDDARVSAITEAADNAGLPLVAVCGRPNVGKSTLFNRLTHSRRSIVGDEPGITRDRIYGEIEWQGKRARLVDTGGVVPDDEALIPSEIFRQAQVALEEADAVVMVVDGRTELAAPDIELARLLQRGGKPIFLAVNKMDTESMEVQAEAFRRLGFRNVLPISAEHGSGIGDLLDDVFAVLPDPKPVEPEVLEAPPTDAEEKAAVAVPASSGSHVRTHGEYDQRETKVAIIGRPNVGKSTLLNALTNSSRAIVSPIAGTTRDAVDEIVERKGHIYRFVDTAGIRRKGKTKLMAEKLSVIMARKHLEAADVSLLIIDATEGVAALDANIGGYAHESGRSVIIVVNKWDAVTTNRTDGKPPLDKKLYEEQVRYALKYLDYAPLLFISALEKKNIDQVFAKTELVSRERRKRVSTGQMNKFLEKVDFQRASVPMAKRVRIFYMTQAAVAPPTFVLFTDKEVKLHFAFERFLANQIRESFGFIGSPIWFKIRARKKVTLAERTR